MQFIITVMRKKIEYLNDPITIKEFELILKTFPQRKFLQSQVVSLANSIKT